MLPCRNSDLFAEGTDQARLIENEAGGVEDPRIARIGDTFFITYSAYHALVKDRVRVSLATTTDFQAFRRHGPLLERDMRNVVIFPERIDGKFVGLFRPNNAAEAGDVGGACTEILIGTADRKDHQHFRLIRRNEGWGPLPAIPHEHRHGERLL